MPGPGEDAIEMQRRSFTAVTLTAAILLPSIAAAKKPAAYEETAPVPLGDGFITAFGVVENGVPQALGVRFDDAVFDNAPTGHSDGYSDVLDSEGNVVWPCCGHERSPTMPANIAATTEFEHIVLNWNPMGHPPPHVYSVPHIDFHFYTQKEHKRIAITPPAAEDMCGPTLPLTCDQLETALEPLPADQQPPEFISPGAVEPRMGNHLLWMFAPELDPDTPSPFSHTWIYGTWGGEITFWEPMITKQYLESQPNECYDVPTLPAAAPKKGWYPSAYCIEFDDGTGQHFVYLTDFVWLPKSRKNRD